MKMHLKHYLLSGVTLGLLLSCGFSVTSFAQNADLDALKSEVKALRAQVSAQERRIEKLESELAAIKANTTPQNIERRYQHAPVNAQQNGWHVPSNWARIKNGMSEQQVISILGKPTSTTDLSSFRTLFYQGEVGDSGFVSGNVQLRDDRVWQVNKPVF